MTSIPTTPAAALAECERVLWLLERATKGNWKFDLSEPDVRIITDTQAAPIATGITCLADASVLAEARRTAQAHADLLAAHADALARLERAEAGGWISVEEQQPEDWEEVLLCLEGQKVVAGFRVAQKYFTSDDSPLLCPPTHWQPLPAPPATAQKAGTP